MDFIKKHYEKILLSAVLLGLAGALVLMGFIIEADKEKSDAMKQTFFGGKVEPLPAIDFSRQTNVIGRLQGSGALDFSTTNKLFNSVQWQKDAGGKLIKITGDNVIGPGAAAVTKITPLYFSITLDSVATNELGARYALSVENQAAAMPMQRRPQRHYASVGDKNAAFTLVSVAGPPENPDQLILKLSTGETAPVSKDKPFQRVDGYSADLKYDPETKKWQGQRAGAGLKFKADDYNIVAIHQNEVVLSAQSNQKRTTLRYAP